MSRIPKALALAVAFAGVCAEAAPPPASRGMAVEAAPTSQRTQPRFDILEYRVLGNRMLPTTAVERAVYPFLGPNGDLEAVRKAADSLEKAYKDAGYGTVFVDVPEQSVDEGVVRLKVTEGILGHARVRGARYFSGRQILAALPALQPGETPHLPTLQNELAALNARTADRSVTPVLKAGSEPGTVDVELAVKDVLPLHGFVSVDDRHTADTTPNRVTAGLSYDNLWQRQDSVSLMYQTAPADPANASVDSATYTAHAGASGLASFSYTHTSSNVLALGTLGVLGKGDIYGAHWTQPLEGSATTSRSFTFGVDYKDVFTQVFPDATTSGASGAPVLAPVRYANWTGAYSQAWRYAHTSLTTNFGVGFGIQGIVNQEPEFENARYDASPAYLYLRWSGEVTQTLPLGLAVLARFSSQWSANPLVNNEQFSLGGLDTVRGYLEAETLGDSGIAGTFELHTPTLPAHLGAVRIPVYAFGFVDAGVATLLDPLPAQEYKLRLWSTGGGLRIENAAGVAGEVDYAIAEAAGLRTRQGQGRVDFTLRYGF